MKFKFENLGMIDYVEIDLADLTLICGENNTGKTYTTYAVYGFLRSWRHVLRYSILDEIEKNIKKDDRYSIDIVSMFEGKVNDYLERMGKKFVEILPRAFATDAAVFDNTSCLPSVEVNKSLFQKSYQRGVQAGTSGKVIATISKEANSNFLEVLVADNDIFRGSMPWLSDFIADAIADIVFSEELPRVHISSAERTGAAIFRKELDMARTRMIKAINEIDSRELKRNPFKIIQEIEADYAWPVEDNVDFVRQLEDIDKKTGDLAKNHPEILNSFNEIIGGSYKVIKQQLIYQAKGASKQRFTMNEASSSIRALLDVGFYLRCRARIGDLFIIDEPELNLHPKNQRFFARLVARLVNAGVKVFITTHSDYLVKEINTLIMLNKESEHTNDVARRYGYEKEEFLDFRKVNLYMTKKVPKEGKGAGRKKRIRTLVRANVTPEHGIEVLTFDETIDLMNKIQDEIVFGGEL